MARRARLRNCRFRSAHHNLRGLRLGLVSASTVGLRGECPRRYPAILARHGGVAARLGQEHELQHIRNCQEYGEDAPTPEAPSSRAEPKSEGTSGPTLAA